MKSNGAVNRPAMPISRPSFPKRANPLAELFAVIRRDSPQTYEELVEIFTEDMKPKNKPCK